MGALFVLTTFVLSYVNAGSIRGDNLPTYDTIVVGLGASGTSAATTLARAGKNVLALEAQNRIGGRVYTTPFDDGVVEVGAEWIHGEVNSRVYELAIQNNVTILPDVLTVEVFRSDGSNLDSKIINDLTGKTLEFGDNPPVEAEPLGQFLERSIMKYIEEKYPELLNDQEFITAYLEYIDLIVDTYEATTSWNDVSTASKAEELDGNQSLSWHRNGYKTLFEILLHTYKNGTGLQNLNYYLNAEVTRIDWTQDSSKKVVVTCKDGRSFTADNVIVTVSVAVLKDRYASLFMPPLPKHKIDAINNIKMGVEGKVMLSFPTRWWGETNFFELLWRKKDKALIEDLWLTKIAEISHPMGASNVLTLWLTGDYAVMMENLPEDEVREKAMGLLRRFLGANYTIPEPLQMIRSQWHRNPYTRGSYTYDDVDYPHHPTARSDLAEPITGADGAPIVLFAGEATDVTHFATVHGAVDTGHREAMRLLNNKH